MKGGSDKMLWHFVTAPLWGVSSILCKFSF